MADTPMSEQAPGGVPSGTGVPNFLELIKAYTQNPQGMTTVGPSMAGYQIKQPTPANIQPQSPARDYASRGAANRADAQNIGVQLSNIASKITQNIEQRKARESQQVFDRFSQSVAGLRQAQAQVQAATQALAQNPNDEQAKQQLLQAQAALQTNKTNLSDMFNGPKGEKNAKILQKGFGIDDKNADNPERQMAIQAVKKAMQVDDNTAKMISRLPQTMQLSPEAQQRALMQQAGVVGKPPTAAQLITAEQKAAEDKLKAEAQAAKVGLETEKMVSDLYKQGLVAVRDESGNLQRNPDGTLKTRNMTMQDIQGNPQLAQKYEAERVKMNALTANADAHMVSARASMLRAQRMGEQAKKAQDPEQVKYWTKVLSDPASGVTLAQVPAAARGMVLKAMADNGLKLTKPLTGDEIKRADLANNAVDNISAAQEILKRRPDMFGPAGWGQTKFQQLLAGGDPDAIDFQADIRLANLPAVGIHGVRGKWAIEDLQKLDGNLYLNAESMGNVLSDINRSATEFSKMGGRRDLSGSGAIPRPAGAKMKVPGNDGHMHWSDGKSDLGIAE